ncbi:LiaI-LiaF-like domain-containing protein [Alteribacter populi]|uniref:LiaI-LiaF-like domain-containing protein n=1 Tax=Alteribacter populi TaxID=2011011 RepID=UPI000BBA990F|nr:DUF5668 domain-containing protein [Alteribacter populi]
MKRNNLIPGLVLIAIGFYFFAKQMDWNIPFAQVVFAWPSILVVIGLMFCFQAFSNKDESQTFSGVTLLGFGLHFHAVHTFSLWSHHWGYFTFILGVAFLAKYSVRKAEGLLPGIVLLAISILSLFYQGVFDWIRESLGIFQQYWPLIFIVIGIYLLFFKKK